MELAYVFGALYHCPRKTLLGVHLPRIDRQLEKMQDKGEEAYGSGFWDGTSLHSLAHLWIWRALVNWSLSMASAASDMALTKTLELRIAVLG
jgi:hypothetical protein